MKTSVAIFGLFCLLAACSAPPTPMARGAALADPVRTDAAAIPAITSATPLHATASPQYAPSELFMAEHGDFMLNHEPWRPNVEVSFFAMSDSEVKNESGDFNLAYGKVRVDEDWYVGPGTFLSTGIDYRQRRYTFSNGALGAHDNTLYTAGLSLGVGQFLDPSLLLEARFKPGVYSDFHGTLHHDDWKFYADSLLTWRVADDLFLKIGAEYSGLFRDVDVYGLLGVTWLIEKDTWRIDMLLPRQARVTFQPSAATAVHVSLDLDGGEYSIRHPQNSSGVQRDINVQEMLLSLGLDHRFNKSFSFQGRVGMTLLGDYVWLDDTANRYDGTLESQLFAEIGFGWTF